MQDGQTPHLSNNFQMVKMTFNGRKGRVATSLLSLDVHRDVDNGGFVSDIDMEGGHP